MMQRKQTVKSTMSTTSKAAAALPVLLITITALLSLSASSASLSEHQIHGKKKELGFSTEIIHRDSPQSPLYNPSLTKSEQIRAAVQRSHSRNRHINSMFNLQRGISTPNEAQPPVSPYYGDYIMKFSIGTPPVPTYAIVDTASELPWVQCAPCLDCYPQTIPIFDSRNSSTYEEFDCLDERCSMSIPSWCGYPRHQCIYAVQYADRSVTRGNLSLETLTFDSSTTGQISFSKMVFGCGNDNMQYPLVPGALNPPGIIGFNQRSSSFIKQLNIEHFSYCLVETTSNRSSRMHFQSKAVLFGGKTPLLQEGGFDVAYYLYLEGISVGSTRLPLPAGCFNATEDGGGFAIDSGAPYTILNPDAYDMLTKELVKQINNKVPRAADPHAHLDPCYKTTLDVIKRVSPQLTFHFHELDLGLNKVGTWLDAGHGIVCFAMVKSDDRLSIFGNIQQQNMNVGFDLENNIVSFLIVEDCDI